MSDEPDQIDWYIDLVPKDGITEGGWIDILHTDEASAILELEAWAVALNASGYVPDVGAWRNRSPLAVLARAGKRRFHVRVDCFEHETENGYYNGGGWLLLREG